MQRAVFDLFGEDAVDGVGRMRLCEQIARWLRWWIRHGHVDVVVEVDGRPTALANWAIFVPVFFCPQMPSHAAAARLFGSPTRPMSDARRDPRSAPRAKFLGSSSGR